jgi:UDP-N-acetylmuramoyl-L-alanyl-D-glutamate--2,6-diaminopimelate ligase
MSAGPISATVEGRYHRRLAELCAEIPDATLAGEATLGDTRITGVRHDSREVLAGDLFVARAGAHHSGETFIDDAIRRGARAVVVARGSSVRTEGVARVEVDDVPRALAVAAAALYGHPTFALDVVGITGTNGKTTTAHLCRALIDGCGGRAGVVGTLGYAFADIQQTGRHTSPEADELARVAAAMLGRGATHLVMEVSSIALAAKRADAVRFRVAAFTNLTQDHLDYHGGMDAYAAAKQRLFTDLAPGAAAINVDDPFGAALATRLGPGGAGPRVLRLARWSAKPNAGGGVEIAPAAVRMSTAGIELSARTPAGEVTIRSRLLGAHNVDNLLTALSIGWLLDFDVRAVAEALSQPVAVPGRLERCDTPGLDDVTVLVDYAHTPDALARVLASVRPFTSGRVICVFGCGGDRDPTKRPLMGEAVGRGADLAVVTNDNPRSEQPRAIVDAIVPGLAATKTRYVVELDRAWAIERAILEAAPGDVVVVAGKGHEPYQIIGEQTLAFDDRDEARRALDARRLGPPTRRGDL